VSAYALTTTASVCGFRASVLDFQGFDKHFAGILNIDFKFPRESAIRNSIPKEDFLGY
jgi:hypothetical protein